LICLKAVSPASADAGGAISGATAMMDWWTGMPWMFWSVVLTLVFTLCLFFIVFSANIPRSAEIRRDALAVLRERFAHGEIDRHEFEEKKRILPGLDGASACLTGTKTPPSIRKDHAAGEPFS
jgi:putative membrane protein